MSFKTFLSLLLIVFGITACGSGSSQSGGSGSDEWKETPLDASSLPPVQMNISSGPQSWVYANVLRASEAWVLSSGAMLSASHAAAAALALPIRPDGWPASLPEGLYLWLNTAGYPTGTDSTGTTLLHGVWVLTWEGKGTVELVTSQNDGSGETTLLDDSVHGRIVKLITSEHKYPVVFVRATDSTDPVRGVKLWAPADDGAGLSLTPASELARGKVEGSLEPLPGAVEPIFHPRFLSHIAEAGSGIPLRMMSFLKINQDPATWGDGSLDWSDKGDASYALGSLSVVDSGWTRHDVAGYRQRLGTPYEWLIDLCNLTGNDLWIQVPHNASENLIRNLARLVAGRNGHPGLDRHLRVWFEYSNELWNSTSAYQAQFDTATAVAAQHFGVAPSAVTTQQRGWGAGHLQGWALSVFENEWALAGGTDDRLINVVAGFALSPGYNGAVLAAVKELDPSLAETLAISNYFGYESSREIFAFNDWAASDGSHWTDDLVSKSKASLRRNLTSTYASWKANAALAAEAGVHLVSYEGGQHLLPVGLGDSSDPAFQKFMSFLEFLERGTVMRQLYTEHYALWAAAGGRTVSLFTDIGPSSYWGFWGAKEWLTDTRVTAGKWDAFLSWTESMRGLRALQEPAGQAPTLDDQAIQGEAGLGLAVTIQAHGGDGPIAIEMVGGELPEGTAFQAGADGTATISGSPVRSATTSIVVRALDADKDPAYRIYTITIDPAGASTNAILRFDGASIPATVQPSGLKNGRYDPVRAYAHRGSEQEALCMPFSLAEGSALFDTEYTDGSTQGGHAIAPTSPWNMYGGWCVTQRQVVGSACETSYTTLRGGEFASWSGANCAGAGYPTTLDLFLAWKKEQFADSTPSTRFSFGDDDASSTLRVDFTDLIADGDNELRFAVLDGGNWYLSEAAYTQQVVGAGYLEVTGFNDSSLPGRRWAAFAPNDMDFAIPPPSSLVFRAQAFPDVRAVALVYRGRRSGYHYNVAFKRFIVLGKASSAG